MMVFLFAINISRDVELTYRSCDSLSPEEAQGFTPLPSDPSLSSQPSFDYPVEIPDPTDSTTDEQETQSTTWPFAKPN